jgi:hypothetical protein
MFSSLATTSFAQGGSQGGGLEKETAERSEAELERWDYAWVAKQ